MEVTYALDLGDLKEILSKREGKKLAYDMPSWLMEKIGASKYNVVDAGSLAMPIKAKVRNKPAEVATIVIPESNEIVDIYFDPKERKILIINVIKDEKLVKNVMEGLKS